MSGYINQKTCERRSTITVKAPARFDAWRQAATDTICHALPGGICSVEGETRIQESEGVRCDAGGETRRPARISLWTSARPSRPWKSPRKPRSFRRTGRTYIARRRRKQAVELPLNGRNCSTGNACPEPCPQTADGAIPVHGGGVVVNGASTVQIRSRSRAWRTRTF
jgi:hypothetical protein